jgi:hypothetical protein
MEKSIVYFEYSGDDIYDLEETVYAVVAPNTVISVEITAFLSHTFKSDENIVVRHYAIRPAQIIVENYFAGISIDEIPFYYLTKEKSEAEHLANFRKVDIPIEMWEKILGHGNIIEEGVKECELDYFDFYSFNFVRDILFKCFNNKGLTNLEINWIREDLRPIISPETLDEIPNLVKVLKELGIAPETYINFNKKEKK